jgi:hypothetical protein
MNLNKHALAFLKAGDYELTDGGILIHGCIMGKGEYFESVNGQDERIHPNLLPTEGINFILGVALGAIAKAAGFFVAPFSGAVTPAANWTAANFAATASEITSQTEGFSGVTRPAWTPGVAAAGAIDNLAAKATFNIVCTTTININGAAILTDNTRGGTAGSLISASRFAATRVVYNGDVWDCGYRVTLTDS